jgi:heme/copper-type cytochrome/quinol oxidase subunit 2
MRSGRRALASALFLGLLVRSDAVLWACPVCFRIEDAATSGGVYAAVFVLLGVTAGVLGGFAAFVIRFVRRAARAADRQA